MQTFSRRLVGQTAAGALLALFLAVPAVAQTAGGPDPMTFDVAGVRLGMTPNDAIAALKRFDPRYVITKQYYAQPLMLYGNDQGRDIKRLADSEKRVAYLYDLAVEKDEQKQECDRDTGPGTVRGGSKMSCWMSPHAVETMTVWFSPVPGQERVIAVQRKAPFEKQPLPAIASLKQGIFAKYPRDQITFESDEGYGGYQVDWIFDFQRRIMSASSARRRNYAPARGDVPQQAHGGDGIGLSVRFGAYNQNAQLADSMSVTLYDGNALYRSIEQSQATYNALKARADAEDANRSRGQTQTRF